MKTPLNALCALMLFTAISCKKDIPGCKDTDAENYNKDATVENGTCTYFTACRNASAGNYAATAKRDCEGCCKYYVYFWTNTPGANIAVNFDNKTGTVMQSFSGSAPGCLAAGIAKFLVSPGQHDFYADDGIHYWSGKVTVYENECNDKLLAR